MINFMAALFIVLGISYAFIRIVTIINPYTEKLLRLIFEKRK